MASLQQHSLLPVFLDETRNHFLFIFNKPELHLRESLAPNSAFKRWLLVREGSLYIMLYSKENVKVLGKMKNVVLLSRNTEYCCVFYCELFSFHATVIVIIA